ncbi:rhodanese-like domain-containing protein [Zobellia barbeyronii]|uniref:Rhodanese-like domain-containing protein n=1 Tax=Zobellia barbeyronii TaxID=2748009 RepID=A0ABS5W9Y1_9FLAO|nr:rhodanese-like domain-containing protein [Zobellia barbeyronii]MBT2159845.1 rhodanese-like domain-containing protein [Zobellia barbeyronii]
MKTILSTLLFFLIASTSFSQSKIDKTLRKLNKESVDYIHVEALEKTENRILLDAREKKEYDVSHLENAIWVGYDTFQLDSVLQKVQNKNSEIVVYCSIGVRSENIGEELEEAGYTNVKNLYGGIFEWKNEGLPVYDSIGNTTEKIHAFNKHWGKLLTSGEKVYDK